jgi:hypothetical protein
MSDDFEGSYEVSHIVDEDYSNPNERVFLVHWLGYSSENDSWEPLENLIDGAIDVVREWDRKQKQAQKQQAQKRKAHEDKARGVQKKAKRRSSQISQDGRKDSIGRVKASKTVSITAGTSLTGSLIMLVLWLRLHCRLGMH